MALLRKFATRLKGLWTWRARPLGLRLLLRPERNVEVIRLGTDYGGWWVPTRCVRTAAVAYCAGVGEDASFDLALLKAGMTVRSFDPTPRAVTYVQSLDVEDMNFVFVDEGWWDAEKIIRFYSPANPAHVSHSAVNLQRTDSYFEARVAPVLAFTERFGDRDLAIVKMDIEGAEMCVIESMIQTGLRPECVLVEYDQPQSSRSVIASVRNLEAAGYDLIKIERWNYSFVKRVDEQSVYE